MTNTTPSNTQGQEQRDPLAALREDILAWLRGGVRTTPLEAVLRARVLPLVEAADVAVFGKDGQNLNHHSQCPIYWATPLHCTCAITKLAQALRALTEEAVKP